MEVELFEHNEIAYQKLVKHLEENQMASIDHATGTGKSFITTKYLHKNKEKRILYLTPTYVIFNQLIDVHFPKLGLNRADFKYLDNIIYRNMLKENMERIASEYDIIVLDEYHRCGAKEWGTKIKELLTIIKEKYPDKKIIGLTATPTRYLDNERDMNEELFKGNSVSTITLGDAIIQGLLQPPLYINTANSYLDYLNQIKKKLKRKITYQEDMAEYQELIDSINGNIQKYLESKLDKDIELPRVNGKYIVFCNTIQEISEKQELIRKKFKDRNLKFFEVHSGQKREKNDEELAAFRNSKDADNFIFVVDILNEGVHVDDIDGIFLLRKTKSPIIYFQQLGRLLSYSTKQKNLVVWDMVDNIKNHPVIYKLYDEVISKAKKLIEEDPVNKDRYQKIIDRFKIVDKYTEIMSKLQEIEKKVDSISEEELLKIRVNRMVKILCDQYKTPTNLPRKVQIEQLFKANSDLYQYYKHITLEQFKLLKKTNLILPPQLNISEEEFENRLLGYKTIHEKELAEQIQIFNTFKRFVENNGRLPSILSNSKVEQDYAYLISINLNKYDKKIRTMFLECIKSLPNEKNSFDKCYYKTTLENIDLEKIFKSLDYCIKNSIPVNENIILLLKRLYVNNELRKKYKIDKYFELLKLKRNIRGSNETEIVPINLEEITSSTESKEKTQDLIKGLKKYGLESIDPEEIKKFVSIYAQELTIFIEKKSRYPNYSEKEEYEKYLAFKPFLEEYGYKKILDKLINSGKTTELASLIEEIIEFMQSNNGDYPSERVQDEEEIKLAKKIKKNKTKLLDYKTNLQIIQRNIRTQYNDNWIYEYISFLEKYQRHPIIQSKDEEEVKLRIRYIRNEDSMSQEEKKQFQKIIYAIGETALIKNTYLERQRIRSEENGAKKR